DLVALATAERPGAAGLEQPDAKFVALDLVDAEFVNRLSDIEIAFAGGDNADLRIAAARGDDAVEFVGAHEGEHRVALVVVQTGFLGEDWIVKPDIEAAGRHLAVRRRNDI